MIVQQLALFPLELVGISMIRTYYAMCVLSYLVSYHISFSKCYYDLDGKWIHENPTVVVNPGDTVNYWVYEIVNGLPQQALDQTWTVGKFPFVEDNRRL